MNKCIKTLSLLVTAVLLGQNLFATKNFLIIANGDWDEGLVRHHTPSRTIVALDGAAANCHKSSIAPHYILGDLDSLPEASTLAQANYFNIRQTLEHFRVIPTPDDSEVKFEEYSTYGELANKESVSVTYVRASSQNYTDLDKGVQFCLSRPREDGEPVDIIIACALGGSRMDHFLGNFSVLKRHHFPFAKIKLVSSLQTIQYLKEGDDDLIFDGPIGAKVGVFGFPSAIAHSEGLKWNLGKEFPLKIGEQESSCNELAASSAKIRLEEGEALVMSPNIH